MLLTKQNTVRRSVDCPQHGKRTSDFLGGQKDIDGRVWWTFRCKQKGGHTFNAIPDAGAPTTVEEALAWEKKQREWRARE